MCCVDNINSDGIDFLCSEQKVLPFFEYLEAGFKACCGLEEALSEDPEQPCSATERELFAHWQSRNLKCQIYFGDSDCEDIDSAVENALGVLKRSAIPVMIIALVVYVHTCFGFYRFLNIVRDRKEEEENRQTAQVVSVVAIQQQENESVRDTQSEESSEPEYQISVADEVACSYVNLD